jgi:transposase-like protein
MAGSTDFLRPLVQEVVQQVLELEMEETLQAGQGERQGYRAGYYGRTLNRRVSKLELRVPQDRQGRFRTEVFERYQRSEKALVSALTEMYVQGVSTRKVKAITEELCGHEFSASAISRMNQNWDEGLEKFARRQLEEAYPYLILDARYEKVREEGVLRSRAVLVAIGINEEARRDLAAWLQKWGPRYLRLCDWVEGNIEQTFSFYRLPQQHPKHLTSSNMLERLSEELQRRTHVVRIFPNGELPAIGTRAGRRDSRELDRGHTVLKHGAFERAEAGANAEDRKGRLRT